MFKRKELCIVSCYQTSQFENAAIYWIKRMETNFIKVKIDIKNAMKINL